MLGVPKLLPRQRVAFLNYRERKPANLRWLVFIDIRLLFRNVHTHLIPKTDMVDVWNCTSLKFTFSYHLLLSKLAGRREQAPPGRCAGVGLVEQVLPRSGQGRASNQGLQAT